MALMTETVMPNSMIIPANATIPKGTAARIGSKVTAAQIVGMAMVETTAVNSILTVRNPEGTAAALTITPLAGGTRPVSAHLVITQLQ